MLYLILAGVLLLFLFIVGVLAYRYTGFLQKSHIDDLDLEKWEFVDGIVKGAESIYLKGNKTCWVMIHGYSSTPDELRIVAEAVHKEFGDTVIVPRLHGHGMVASSVEKYSMEDWYQQIRDVAQKHNCQYLLGSSAGSIMALRYAEEYEVKGLVLAGTAFDLAPRFLPQRILAPIAYHLFRYMKRKNNVPGATIRDPQGRAEHIATHAFPLKGYAELVRFNRQVKKNIKKVSAQVLFLHAAKDTVATLQGAQRCLAALRSPARLVQLAGDHIVFRDFDKHKAVQEVLKLRRECG